MKHDLGAREDPVEQGRIEDVPFDDGQAVGHILQILTLARGEVVEHRDVVAACDQGAGERGSNESGTSGDDTLSGHAG